MSEIRPIVPRGVSRASRTQQAHTVPNAHDEVGRGKRDAHVAKPGEIVVDMAELGEEATQSAGVRLRSRRYSSAFILSHNTDSLLNEFAEESATIHPCEASDLLDLATRLFDDASDAYAALDVLSQHADLASFADVFREAQAQLCALETPEWVVAGLDAALTALAYADASGLSAPDLRDLYRTFVLSAQPAVETFGDWVRRYRRARRRVVLAFIEETLAAQIAMIDPACGEGEGEWLVGLLRTLRYLTSGERDFVRVLRSAASRVAHLRIPEGADADAPFSLIFVSVVAGELSADAMMAWVCALGVHGASARVVMLAALQRAVRRMSGALIDDPASRDRMLRRFEALGETLADEERCERPRLLRTGHA